MKIDNKLLKGYLRQLDETLEKSILVQEFHSAIEKMASHYKEHSKIPINGQLHIGDMKIDPQKLEQWITDFNDTVAPLGQIHTLYRDITYRNISVIGKAIFFFADVENCSEREESLKYCLGSLCVNADPTGARLFSSYIPFRLTRHAIIRILERSHIVTSKINAANRALSTYALDLIKVLKVLPCFVAAIVTTKYPYFALPVADGLLLCELFEETTYYEASETYISAIGISNQIRSSIFGNPEQGVSRVFLAKTWIGPSEIKRNQYQELKKINAFLKKHASILDLFMNADFFRHPNWIDKDAPSYEEPELPEFIDAVKELSLIIATKSYQNAFRGPKKKI